MQPDGRRDQWPARQGPCTHWLGRASSRSGLRAEEKVSFQKAKPREAGLLLFCHFDGGGSRSPHDISERCQLRRAFVLLHLASIQFLAPSKARRCASSWLAKISKSTKCCESVLAPVAATTAIRAWYLPAPTGVVRSTKL